MPIFVTVCVCAMPCPAIAVVSPPTPHRAVDGVRLSACCGGSDPSLGCGPKARAPEAGRLYAPLITAGDAAVLSAQGVLQLCKEDDILVSLFTDTRGRALC